MLSKPLSMFWSKAWCHPNHQTTTTKLDWTGLDWGGGWGHRIQDTDRGSQYRCSQGRDSFSVQHTTAKFEVEPCHTKTEEVRMYTGDVWDGSLSSN